MLQRKCGLVGSRARPRPRSPSVRKGTIMPTRGRRRVLGDEHPDTLRSATYLAVTLRSLGGEGLDWAGEV